MRTRHRNPADLLNAIADVVLGRSCAGCDAPGIALCHPCRIQLQPTPRLRRSLDLGEISAGLHVPVACSLDYRGAVRQVLYRFKDHRIPQLARAVAPALAASIDFAAAQAGMEPEELTLVPLPTRRGAARRRGFDPIALVTKAAVRTRPVAGVRSSLVDLRTSGATKTLGVWERQAAAAGAFEATGHLPRGPVLLVDDIVTTGATAREAVATLMIAGVQVAAVATIAGTP